MAINFDFEKVGDEIGDSLKSFEFNRGTLLLLGVGVVVVIVLVNRRSAPPVEPITDPNSIEVSGYPSYNASQLEDQFANYSSIILGQVNATLEGYHNDIMDQSQDLVDQNREYIDQVRDGLEREIGVDPETVDKRNSVGWTIGYGTGQNNHPTPNIDFAKDRGALKEEIDRTLSVISYREGKGLDNSAQQRHLNNLRTL